MLHTMLKKCRKLDKCLRWNSMFAHISLLWLSPHCYSPKTTGQVTTLYRLTNNAFTYRGTRSIFQCLFLIKTRLPRRHSRDLLRYFAHQPTLWPLEGFQFPSHTIPVRYGMFHALWLFSAPLTMWSGWLLLMLVFSLIKTNPTFVCQLFYISKLFSLFFPVPW